MFLVLVLVRILEWKLFSLPLELKKTRLIFSKALILERSSFCRNRKLTCFVCCIKVTWHVSCSCMYMPSDMFCSINFFPCTVYIYILAFNSKKITLAWCIQVEKVILASHVLSRTFVIYCFLRHSVSSIIGVFL